MLCFSYDSRTAFAFWKHLQQAAELVFVKQLAHCGVAAGCQRQVANREVYVDVIFDGHQKLAHLYMVARSLKALAQLWSEFVQMGIDILYAAVFANQFLGADLAHAGHTGDIVGGIAPDS